MSNLYTAVASCARRVEKNEQNELCGTFTFTTDFIGFSGHFPEKPVLPGIAQMMAVLHTCAAHGIRIHMAGVKSCKFMHPVFPEERLEVTVRLPENDNGLFRAVTRVDDQICADMAFTAADAPRENRI